MPRKYPQFVIRDVSRHGQERFYYRRGSGPRYRLPPIHAPEFAEKYLELHGKSDAELGNVGEKFHVASPMQQLQPRRRKFADKGYMTFEQYLGEILRSARTRARMKKVPFDIDKKLVMRMAEEQANQCALTGIPFFTPASAKSRIPPFVPSIDRITPSLGYVAGNVRLVCFAINAMMLDWGEEVFAEVAEAYRKTKNRTHPVGDKGIRNSLLIRDLMVRSRRLE